MEGLSNYAKETPPWGSFERFTLNEKSTVKLITINPGEELSLQQHAHRDEEWRILSGSGKVTVDERVTDVKPGDTYFITRGTRHRVAGGMLGLTLLEIALGDFDEKDITRFEDRYGRS
jgi:mannose-6-phosphate isomerase-like protein (cupin superfamily)